ncbi:7115_t:CDS:2 [Rhizophagus irregularis]|nr:7115_t:CDS:2 [Rhizophagus irregularis]
MSKSLMWEIKLCPRTILPIIKGDGIMYRIIPKDPNDKVPAKFFELAASYFIWVNPIDSQISAVSWLVKSPTIYCQ